ncbi:hypothetical protein PVAP13_2NG242275 [Panicum virgatum]|uniref:Uncharacterized protein n=1 Tax=Panicum virgatum TaxID=38727 RepID=A0A8T0VB03_PANVG|nr:hypothetical protein PVAP13_2NG242275 [Panicum virgatum]
MAATLPHSHLHLHLPLRTPDPSSRRRHRFRLPSLVAASRLQNPTTATHPVLPPPAPAPSAALLAAEGASLAPRREHRFSGSVSTPTGSAAAGGLAEAEDAVLRRALEVRRAVAAEVLVAALSGGKVGGLTYINNLTARMGLFVDRIVVEAAAMRRDRPDLAHMSFNARAKVYIQESGLVELVKSFEELEEIIDYLESCGVRRDWIGYVVSRCPQLLNLSMDELETRVRFYTDMGMDEKDFGTMVYDYPRVLGFLSLEEMNSKVQYLKEFGLSNEELGRLLAFKPQLMACSIEERWKPLVKYLYHLNVSRDGMKRMLLVQPTIFCLDLETVIAPKVQFLQDIGVRSDAIGNVLVKFPPVLTYSLYKKIRPVDDIGKVIALDPQLLGCSIAHKLEVSVKYFRSLGIYHFVLGQMVADFPALLRYNVDILKPKIPVLEACNGATTERPHRISTVLQLLPGGQDRASAPNISGQQDQHEAAVHADRI